MVVSDSTLRAVLDSLSEGIYLVDRDRTITYWSAGAARISGHAVPDVVGRSCHDGILQHCDASGNILCDGHCPLQATMSDGEPREERVYLRHADGHRVPVTVRSLPLRSDAGEIIGAIETFTDDTQSIAVLEQIESLQKDALVDPLTGLSNRRATEEHIRGQINSLERYGSTFGIVMADVDHFKAVNDTYGHLAGDEALRTIARTLRSDTRSFDLVGRIGGEEFVSVLAHVTPADLRIIADRMVHLVANSQPVIENGPVTITISAGATVAEHGDTMETLLARADRMLYASKRAGRNRATLWDADAQRAADHEAGKSISST